MSERQESPSVASAPNILEAYRDYIPPQCVRKMVDDLLKAAPPRYLVGLQTIILTNQAAQPRKKKQQKTWSRNRKIKLVEALGYYSGASRSSRASITLHIDNIFKGATPRKLRDPFARYYLLASVLYHEIGHHIHAEHNPVYEGKENVAEDWGDKLVKRFYRTHYWYLMSMFEPLGFLIKLSGWVNTRIRQITKTRNPDPKRDEDF